MDKQAAIHPENGFYLMIKRRELSSQERTQRHLKRMLLSDRSQSEKLHTVGLQPHGLPENVKLRRQ